MNHFLCKGLNFNQIPLDAHVEIYLNNINFPGYFIENEFDLDG